MGLVISRAYEMVPVSYFGSASRWCCINFVNAIDTCFTIFGQLTSSIPVIYLGGERYQLRKKLQGRFDHYMRTYHDLKIPADLIEITVSTVHHLSSSQNITMRSGFIASLQRKTHDHVIYSTDIHAICRRHNAG